MRLFVDACVGATIVDALRKVGHDIVYAQEGRPGVDDETHFKAAARDGRLVVTEDHDFGVLAVRDRRPCVGVVLISLHGLSRQARIARVVRLFADGDGLVGRFTVLEPGRTRSRPLEVDGG